MSKRKLTRGLIGSIGLAVLTVALSVEAKAEVPYYYRYPWCAQYNLPGGPTSCRFATFAQCLPEVRGVGGQCVVNPYYAAYHASDRGGQVAPRRRGARQRR